MRGVILYGPPASGKDTITSALRRLDSRYALFPRLKAGKGRVSGYRMTTLDEIERLRAKGEVLWENHRYGATYAVDRDALLAHLRRHIGVIHLGQPEAVEAIVKAIDAVEWLVVYLHCPRDIAAQRIEARGTGDVEARLRAWDETLPMPGADLGIDTAKNDADTAARIVHEQIERCSCP